MALNKSIKKGVSLLHKWLGLISGAIVFIVSITGCIYAFHQEIEDWQEPWRKVAAEDRPFVVPGVLLDTAAHYVPGKKPTGLTYSHKEGAAAVGFFTRENNQSSFTVVFMNPYTGKHIKTEEHSGKGSFDFFHFIEDGHTSLWLPHKIGKPIVGGAVLLFFIILITGVVMWWPAKMSKAQLKGSFTVKTDASKKRLIFDLHKVVGFYSVIFALIIATTGLVWSYQWFEDGLYFITSGGKTKPAHEQVLSKNVKPEYSNPDSLTPLDIAWKKTVAQNPDIQGVFINPGQNSDLDAIAIFTYQKKGKFYDRNAYYYDRNTLEPIRVAGDRYSEASFADKLSLMNYDLHTGGILGLPGKILVFFVGLVCASLPVTGFLLWNSKRKKR